MNNMPTYVSVIIPAFNEDARIEHCLDAVSSYLATQDYSWEVIVCNDGSTDRTSELVRRFVKIDSRINLIDLLHQGKGSAVRAGMLKAEGEVRILCDADFSMPVEHISRLIHAGCLYDIAIASRELPDSRRFNEPQRRHFMGRVFNYLTRLLILPGIMDSQCGFKLFNQSSAKELFQDLNVSGFAFDVEILAKARKHNFSITEVPIDWYYFEGSKVRILRDSIGMFKDLMKLRIKYNRIR